MRVALLHSQSRETGGADAVMAHQAAMLSKAGHEVHQMLYPAVPASPSPRHAVQMVWNRDAYVKVKELANSFKPDVVHVHAPYPRLSPAVFRAAVDQGAATVTTLHNYRPACPIGTFYRDGQICTECLGRRVKAPAVRHACYHGSHAASAAMVASIALHRTTFSRYVHRYLTFTAFGADLLAKEGLPQQLIGVCPNTVPAPPAVPVRGNRAKTVLFSGRLVPEKGIATLLTAWPLVPHDVTLLVAGDGPLLGLVREVAARDALSLIHI